MLGGSSFISNAQKIRDSLLSDQQITSHITRSVIERNLQKSKLKFSIADEEVQAVYDDFKQRMSVDRLS